MTNDIGERSARPKTVNNRENCYSHRAQGICQRSATNERRLQPCSHKFFSSHSPFPVLFLKSPSNRKRRARGRRRRSGGRGCRPWMGVPVDQPFIGRIVEEPLVPRAKRRQGKPEAAARPMKVHRVNNNGCWPSGRACTHALHFD